MKILKELCQVHAPSGFELGMKEYLLKYVKRHMNDWKTKPQIISGDQFQDCLILVFGNPRTAIFAHMDSIGFTVRYFNQLLPIGSPHAEAGATLVGKDSLGKIECELEFDKDNRAFYKFGRAIDRGTSLTYKSNFRNSKNFVQSPYLDNRLGVYNALKIAEKMKDGAIVFSCWEEHGGGTVGYLAGYLLKTYGIQQALISDITWATDGVELGKGVAISLRDRNIPRRAFVNKIIEVAEKRKVNYQLEVEGSGSSDGGEIQRSPFPIDWCFVGAPSQDPHTPHEKVHKKDIDSMIDLYHYLMKDL